MKKVILMRHAEAPHDSSLDDFNRILSPAGELQAAESGEYLINHSIKIHKILCSPALRTRQTLEIMQNSGVISNVELCDEIYTTSEQRIMDLIGDQSESYSSILVLGHNPTISYTYFAAIGNDELEQFSPATCAILYYDQSVAWREIFYNTPVKNNLFIPKIV
jgi:phosphohistidine phosphatase